MNKRGFTLVELLGVIVLLAIVTGLVVLSMSGVIGTGKLSVYKTYEKSFKTSVENYFIDNPEDIPTTNEPIKYYLKDIISKNYIDELKDPNKANCNYLDNNSYVLVSRDTSVSNNYKLKYSPCLICVRDGEEVYKSEECNVPITINFETNGGTGIDGSLKIPSDSTTYGELPSPIKTGYEFDGWYLDSTFTTPITSSSGLIIKNDHTLYAKWLAYPTITYTRNNSTVTVSCTSNSNDVIMILQVNDNNVSITPATTVSYNYDLGTCSSVRSTSLSANCTSSSGLSRLGSSPTYSCVKTGTVPSNPPRYKGLCQCNIKVGTSINSLYASFSDKTSCTDVCTPICQARATNLGGTVMTAKNSSCNQSTVDVYEWSN